MAADGDECDEKTALTITSFSDSPQIQPMGLGSSVLLQEHLPSVGVQSAPLTVRNAVSGEESKPGSNATRPRDARNGLRSAPGPEPLGGLATAVWQPFEAPVDGERCRRPLDGLPRLDIHAGGELDEKAAVNLVGACPRGGEERTGGPICGPAAQTPPLFCEHYREHEVRSWSDPPFVVGLDDQLPAVRAEFEVVVFDAADLRATAGVVEPQIFVPEELRLEFGREDSEERTGGAWLNDLNLK